MLNIEITQKSVLSKVQSFYHDDRTDIFRLNCNSFLHFKSSIHYPSINSLSVHSFIILPFIHCPSIHSLTFHSFIILPFIHYPSIHSLSFHPFIILPFIHYPSVHQLFFYTSIIILLIH